MFADQSESTIRFEWGLHGLRAISADAIVVLVDIFSFTTSVTVACSRGAIVFPCRWDDQHAGDLAAREDAKVVARRGQEHYTPDRFSLSPESLLKAGPDLRLVLPSQNGSVVAYEASSNGRMVVAASFRNAAAVGAWLNGQDSPIAVIAAGERWEDGTGRFSVEDLLGAGAVIANLQGRRSPEAASAEAAFQAIRGDVLATLRRCSSGRELLQRGFDADVALAAELNVENAVPVIDRGAFIAASSRPHSAGRS